MRTKRMLSVLLCIVLCLGCLLMLAACGGDTECAHESVGADGKCTECGEQISAPEPPTGDGEVALVKNGAANFKIVVGSSANKIIQDIDSLITKINGLLTTGTERVADNKSTEGEIEIIIGSVNSRGDDFKVDEHYLGHKGYEVKLVGNKIVVYAGDVTQYKKALDWLEEDVFGIKKSTDSITNLIVDAAKVNKQVLTEYDIDSVKIAGNDLDDYVIAINKNVDGLNEVASTAQDAFYRNFGAWCDIVSISKVDDYDKVIHVNLTQNTRTGNGFSAYVTEGGNLMIDCEFENKLVEVTEKTLIDGIASVRKNTNIPVGEYLTYDVRNIYYADFGAKGDGFTDDFAAIKACHDYANLYGHVANSDGASKVYYIGKGNGNKSIIVQTDTNWHGCKFIFDDSEIAPNDPERNTSIFWIKSSSEAVSYGSTNTPVTSLELFAPNIGWAPGYKAQIFFENSGVKHYIRFGLNENSGSSQHEVILVDENGNVDPTTPIQWEYKKITTMRVYRIDDEEIVISGADDGDMALIETIFNGAPSQYTYYKRNLLVERSNVTIKNVKHIISGQIPQKDSNGNITGQGAPYDGFTKVENCNNVTIDGFLFQCPDTYYVVENGSVTNNNMGSYEMNAKYAINLTYRNCKQSNFFEPDGSVVFKGLMGTNHCRNLEFDNMMVTSFDAHEGVYNVKLKDSTCEHLNFIGKGTVTIENVTVYVDGTLHSAFNLRPDYGSTWDGDFVIDGLTLKYYEYFKGASYNIALFNVGWENHFFGYTTYMPRNIIVNNLKTVSYDFELDEQGNRLETELKVNDRPVYIFSKSVSTGGDYTTSVLNATNTECPHTAPDASKKRCEGCGATWNLNPYMPTEVITITNEDPANPVKITWMTSPSFKNTVVTVDGKKITVGV